MLTLQTRDPRVFCRDLGVFQLEIGIFLRDRLLAEPTHCCITDQYQFDRNIGEQGLNLRRFTYLPAGSGRPKGLGS